MKIHLSAPSWLVLTGAILVASSTYCPAIAQTTTEKTPAPPASEPTKNTPTDAPSPSNTTAKEEADSAPDNDNLAIPEKQEDLPNVALTSEIFFKIVTSEIAFQRGDFGSAYSTLMALGQQTHDPRLPKRAMEMALVAKQPFQAMLSAKLWREYSPKSDDALQYYLTIILANNDWKEIQNALKPRLANASAAERGALILQITQMLARSEQKENAFKALDKLLQPYPGLLETHLGLAQTAFASNNHVRALVEAKTAMRIDPNSALAVLTLAQVSPSPQEGLETLSNYLIAHPNSPQIRRAYAGMLIDQKQYAQARSQFILLREDNPTDPNLMFTLGVLSLQLNDNDTAESNLTAFITSDPHLIDARDASNALLYLSQIADDKKNGEAALAWLEKIPSNDGKNPVFANAQMRRAVLLSRYQSLDAARQFLHQIEATGQDKVAALELEAELLRNAGQIDAAYKLLKEATATYTDNAELYYDLAMTAEKAEKLVEMEQALRRAIEINPRNAQPYNALGYAFVERNIRLPEARELIQKAFDLAPNDPFIMDSMGWVEYRQNNLDAALDLLQRAYKIRPDPEIAVHIGEVLWVMGKEQEAREMWAIVAQKEANNASLKSTLERLKVTP